MVLRRAARLGTLSLERLGRVPILLGTLALMAVGLWAADAGLARWAYVYTRILRDRFERPRLAPIPYRARLEQTEEVVVSHWGGQWEPEYYLVLRADALARSRGAPDKACGAMRALTEAIVPRRWNVGMVWLTVEEVVEGCVGDLEPWGAWVVHLGDGQRAARVLGEIDGASWLLLDREFGTLYSSRSTPTSAEVEAVVLLVR